MAEELDRSDTADRHLRPPASEGPGGFETITTVLDDLRARGMTGSFIPGDEVATLRCTGCDRTSNAEAFEVVAERRLEGASDPDDMVLVVGARCPACHRSGTVVLGYGPEASPEDADLLMALG